MDRIPYDPTHEKRQNKRKLRELAKAKREKKEKKPPWIQRPLKTKIKDLLIITGGLAFIIIVVISWLTKPTIS